jgi:hypothetical protein
VLSFGAGGNSSGAWPEESAMSMTLTLSDAETLAVLNALNYFAHAIDADECHTLVGLDQSEVQSLLKRLSAGREQPPVA